MENNLKIILNEYLKDIEDACSLLINNINKMENLKLKNKYDFFDYRASCGKMEYDFDDNSYRFHGSGCSAHVNNFFLEWDFGYRSRWVGIDPWKVAITLKKNKSPFEDYYDGELIKVLCEEMVCKGEMYKKYEKYYFLIRLEETFVPTFPIEYDTLRIEYNDLNCQISRNKIIDRFIRKTVRIQKKINEAIDNYALIFYLEGKEVFSIPYNERYFPENAVKLMSDEIIRNSTWNKS